jgi:acylphosphatase
VSQGAASPKAVRYLISGRVQGVGYRFFAKRTAERLHLMGFAKNLPDGRVEVYAIGPAELLAALRIELNQGPHGASVSSVTEEDAPIDLRYAAEFSIEH